MTANTCLDADPVINRPAFRLSRRAFCMALPALHPGLARAATSLRVLAWPGYADAEAVRSFEARHQVRVEVSTIDSDAEMWNRLTRGEAADFDVFAVNTAELQRYIAARLVVPIAAGSVPNMAKQLPRFRDVNAIPGLVHGGRTFGVPYTYSEMGLIYDRRQLAEPPASIAALWDERHAGRVVAYDGGTHNFSLAAQSLGLRSPFRLEQTHWPLAVERLIALRRQVAGFYTQPDESVELFTKRRAVLMFANYGHQQLKLIRAAGIDAGYTIPKEGALAWLDCWAVTRGARDPVLATAWIDHLLEPEAGRRLTQQEGLANTTTASPEDHASDRLTWLQPVESEERRNLLWRRILSGDRASKVLAP